MRETVRLTMAQALVKFLTKQYVSVDGEKSVICPRLVPCP